jgi:flagellar basal body-associated protein FliL
LSEGEQAQAKTQGLTIFLIMIVVVLLIGMNVVWYLVLSKKFKGEKQ